MAFTLTQDTSFQHCDPAGLIFYPRYFEMLNLTIEKWFAGPLGYDFKTLHMDNNKAVPTAHVDVDFKTPGRLGDRLEFRLVPTRLGNTSLHLEITAYCADDMRLVARFILVFTDKLTGKPEPWPAPLAKAICQEIEKGPVHA